MYFEFGLTSKSTGFGMDMNVCILFPLSLLALKGHHGQLSVRGRCLSALVLYVTHAFITDVQDVCARTRVRADASDE